MALPVYATTADRLVHYAVRTFAGCVFLLLIGPLIVIVPISFNAVPTFTFDSAMLALDPQAFSLRWYQEVFGDPAWIRSIKNSFVIATCAACLSMLLGTLAALGLSRTHMPHRLTIMGILISPIAVPIVITGAGMFFFYTSIGLAHSKLGVIVAHTALGAPFVVVTVTATLVGFDWNLSRASASLGAPPLQTFLRVVGPLILPGLIAGGLFAFVISFDEVVCVLFIGGGDQQTIPRQMWADIRQGQVSPSIFAASTLLIAFSVCLVTVLEALRRRTERLTRAPGASGAHS